MDAVGRGSVESPVAAVNDRRAGRGDKGLGALDRRDDGRGRVNRRRGPAVDLFGREHRRRPGEQAGFAPSRSRFSAATVICL